MVRFLSTLAIVCALLAVTGCSNLKKTEGALRKPTLPGQVQPPTSAAKLPAGEYLVLIDSEPSGATVVVNGIPVGKAPQRVVLPGTPRGFSREQVSLKVRFVAADTAHVSKTVEDLLTPLDKIPGIVRFTPSGPNRIAR